MARIVVTAPADVDVAAILDHLTANAGRLIAAKYAEAFDAAYGRLAAFLRIGPTRPALGLHGKRDITGDLIGRR
jgi:plasmid stabilization system protein ParE